MLELNVKISVAETQLIKLFTPPIDSLNTVIRLNIPYSMV